MKLLHNIFPFIMSLFAIAMLSSFARADPKDSMLVNIDEAKTRLARTENKIIEARVALANELRILEQQVIKLRNETSVARRKMDERTLSLSQLENRLSSWSEQQEFQQNLLNRFLLQTGVDSISLNGLSLSDKVKKVGEIANAFAKQQTPNFMPGKVVLANGEISDAQVLTLGPVTWYLAQDQQVAGTANTKQALFSATSTFDDADRENLSTLAKTGRGSIHIDPTLGRAATKAQASEGITEHVIKGGVWVIPIVLFALIATLIALFKVVQLWRLPKVKQVASGKALVNMVGNSGVTFFKGMQRKLYDITKRAGTPTQRDDELFSQLQQDKITLEKYNGTIAVTAAVAPLLGLLGTVSGMIETFRMMTAFGSSDPEVISGGIAKALVTTELGLVVAIPALILNAVLSRKARHYYEELESFALVLSNDEPESVDDADVPQARAG
ncbi:MotA/TolQ/ExbB proton channel family protein [Aestuariibacter sp. A3R04]|uniref:MotA/TolQ/ExbB proton channel family protein n=1 Tax=Aestuariibacter sp. A3R04 TaxID=2841571 RepID=UPI001C0A316B|nr:MotA/TolQ/ExbB proton channel family protein [Aestuariibacter sp. A3R04]MBU3023958.1 MotA/TolQ/ExbB proton channel family protein [Aestuariibacter sp. A3R04]